MLGGGDEAVPRVRLAAAGDGASRAGSRRSSRGRSRRTTSTRIRRRRRTSGRARRCRPACARRSRTIRCRRRTSRARRRTSTTDAKRRLASLGYVGAGAAPVVRKDAPRPADMMRVVPDDRARRPRCSPPATSRRRSRCSQKVLAGGSEQPRRRAAARDRALVARAGGGGRGDFQEGGGHRAEIAGRPHLSRAALRADEGVGARGAAARAGGDGEPGPADGGRGARADCARARGRRRWTRGGRRRRSPAFERARALHAGRLHERSGARGALPGARRFAEARTALDRALAARPDDAMALFKRAQVSVLLNEPDSAGEDRAGARDERMRRRGRSIERERLFKSERSSSSGRLGSREAADASRNATGTPPGRGADRRSSAPGRTPQGARSAG